MKSTFILKIIFFLILNFGALAIGSYLMDNGPTDSWYASINKAPWSPPGWIFGAAWTTIMLCFSMYMALLYRHSKKTKTITVLFTVQWILNILWNPLFFKFHEMGLGLLILILLIGILIKLFSSNVAELKYKSIWIAPYILWMMVAISLNGYVYLFN